MTSRPVTGHWRVSCSSKRQPSSGLLSPRPCARRQRCLRKEIVTGITAPSTWRRGFKPLSPFTLAARKLAKFRGTKALLVRGDLRNAVSVVVRGADAFVGVPRKARGKGGRAVIDVAEMQEFGSDPIVIPMTPRMRRFLFALYRQADTEPSDPARAKAWSSCRSPRDRSSDPRSGSSSIGVDRRFLRRVSIFLGWGR